jgi:hypothetical protein
VILEVDEAGGLEAFENCGGRLLLCGRVAGQEGGEVDELWEVSAGRYCLDGVCTGISRSSCETAESTVMCAMLLNLGYLSIKRRGKKKRCMKGRNAN